MLAPDWTGSLCFWFSAACVYYATMYYADARQRRRNAPPLDDVGFELSPRLPQLQVVCDSCGVGGALWMFSVLFVGDAAHTEYVRALFDYNALGNVLSSTLHVVTILPTAEFADSGLPLMGGSADKLMSNHTFNFSIGLRAVTLCYGWPAWALPLGVAVYSSCLVCTRCHYTVDIVLAWWVLLFVLALDPGLTRDWLSELAAALYGS